MNIHYNVRHKTEDRHLITRRSLIHRSALTLGAFSLPVPLYAASNPIVETSNGSVEGMISNGVHVFKGVRYGADTSGTNRFMPPQDPIPWAGVRTAFDYGAQTAQVNGGSEDCLFLNIWTPSVNDDKRRPVMVWLHGGGFASGSGSSPWYDGTQLATIEDVVVVTLNHRLNVFGATHLAHLGGDAYIESGSTGMLDIVHALKWVQLNIDRFGGDAGRVMVFGESGGGRKVSTLLGMPTAEGLFHSAIIQSGAVLELRPEEDGVKQTDLLFKETGAKSIGALQSLPVEKLLSAHARVHEIYEPTRAVVGMTEDTPVINPLSMPRHPFEPDGPAVSKDVAVMAGYNRTEELLWYNLHLLREGAKSMPMQLDMTAAQLEEKVAERLEGNFEGLVDAYASENPGATPWDLYMLICTDHPRGTYPKELAVRKSKAGGAPAYVYRFDWELNDAARAFHALDIPFVFNNLDRYSAVQKMANPPRELAGWMSAAWASFARSQDPNVDGLPQWSAYDEKARSTMIFNSQSEVIDDPNPESRRHMQKVLGLA